MFDSSDLDTIYDGVISGKESISQNILTKNPTYSSFLSGDSTDTFATLALAIEKQTVLPTDAQGYPVLPTLTTSYNFTAGPDNDQVLYTYNNVDIAPISKNGFVYNNGAQTSVNNTILTYSDDLPAGKFAYTPEGYLAIGSGKLEQDAYNRGLADGAVSASVSGVEIHYHTHVDACYGECGSTSYTDINNNPNGWDYHGNGVYSWSETRRCNICGQSMGSSGGNTYSGGGQSTYDNRTTVCHNIVLKCGKDTHTLEYLVINGVRYEP